MAPPLVLVAGTGTEIGKTWVASRLVAGLRAGGLVVAARKPAQSHDPDDPPESLDAAVLAAASAEPVDSVCPPSRTYPVPMAPPMAAAVAGRPSFGLAELAAGLRWARTDGRPVDVGVVETAGGVCSPQAEDGDAADLARLLRPAVAVLVAHAGLGTINAVRATAAPLLAALRTPAVPEGTPAVPGGAPLVVVLNRFDPATDLHRRNRAWLRDRERLTIVTVPGDEPELVRLVVSSI